MNKSLFLTASHDVKLSAQVNHLDWHSSKIIDCIRMGRFNMNTSVHEKHDVTLNGYKFLNKKLCASLRLALAEDTKYITGGSQLSSMFRRCGFRSIFLSDSLFVSVIFVLESRVVRPQPLLSKAVDLLSESGSRLVLGNRCWQ